jgi:hypothetical protein
MTLRFQKHFVRGLRAGQTRWETLPIASREIGLQLLQSWERNWESGNSVYKIVAHKFSE